MDEAFVTLTETLIILDITKTESSNCFIINHLKKTTTTALLKKRIDETCFYFAVHAAVDPDLYLMGEGGGAFEGVTMNVELCDDNAGRGLPSSPSVYNLFVFSF